MFLLFAFFVIILMLNLLIAIMGDAYTKVKESELVEGLHERAKLIVEHERMFAGRQTYCRYLHVAEAVAESEGGGLTHVWEGLGGRIKELRRELQQDHDDSQAQRQAVEVKAEAKLEAVEAKLEAVEAKLEAGLEAMEAKVDRVEAGMKNVEAGVEVGMANLAAKLDAVLEKLVA
jgi:hypothetical protein